MDQRSGGRCPRDVRRDVTKVLVLGANGQLARKTIPFLLKIADIALTLYLRRAQRLRNPDPDRVAIVEGDVLNSKTLRTAMQRQDVVYANLAGDMTDHARAIIDAIHAAGVKRLIFISSMGIYGEVPGAACWTLTAIRRLSSRRRIWTTRSCGLAGSPTTTRSTTRSRRKAKPSKVTPPRSHRALHQHAALCTTGDDRTVTAPRQVSATAVVARRDRRADAAHRGLERREPVPGADCGARG